MLFFTRWKKGHLLCNCCLSSSQARHFSQLSQGQAENLHMVLCGQARIQFHSVPTWPQRVRAIPSPLRVMFAVFFQWTTKPAPSLSVVSAFEASRLRGFAVFLWRICAPSPPLEILSRISLERMARIGKEFSHPCMFTRSQVLFFFGWSQELAARYVCTYHTRKSMALSSGRGHGIFRHCESGEFYYSTRSPNPQMVSGLRMHNFRSLQRLKGAFTFTPPLIIMNRLRCQRVMEFDSFQ